MHIRSSLHVARLGLLFTLLVGAPFVPQAAWAQTHEAPHLHDSDPLVPEERVRVEKGGQVPMQQQAAPPAKSLPNDVEVIDPAQTFVFDHNPDDQLNFDFTGVVDYAGDINGDGIDDYIRVEGARDERTGELEDGVYKTAVFFGGTPAPSAPDQVLYEGLLPVGDLNGDGMADAVVRTDNGVRIYTGTSTGYEDTSVELDTKSLPSQPLFDAYQFIGGEVDLDGDGFDDVLIGTDGEEFDIVYGDADLSDMEVESYSEEYSYLYETADLDGDGTAEIVRATIDAAGRFSFSVGRIEDRQTFTEIQSFVAEELYIRPLSLWLIDITGDGAREIVASEYSLTTISTLSKIYFQESELFFSETPATFSKGAVPAGDLNNDGRHDFYTRRYNEEAARYENYISYGPSNLDDGLSYDVAIPINAGERFERPQAQHAGYLGDITGNGLYDGMTAVYNYADQTLERRIISVDESSDLDTTNVTYPRGAFYNRIVATHHAGDLNGDGVDDVAMVNNDLGEVYLFYGGSEIASEPDATLRSDDAYFPYHAVSGDFDGDGHDDLAVAFKGINRANSQIAIYLGENPSGAPDHTIAFDEVAPEDYSNGFSYLAAADIDDDGDDDLLAASFDRIVEAAFVFLGQPSLPDAPDWVIDYTERPYSSYYAGASMANLGDVNGDGIDDVAIGLPQLQLPNRSGVEGAVHIYYGQEGTGPDFDSPDQVLEPPISMDKTYEGFGYGLAGGGDFNGDGFHDIAVAPVRLHGDENYTVHLFFGSESGVSTSADVRLRAPAELFGPNARDNDDGYLAESQPHLEFIPDVDGDGDDELLMTTGDLTTTNAVAYLGGSEDETEPSAVFRAPNQRAPLGGPYGAAVGDFTGSGSLDYVLTQTYDNNDAARSSRVYRYAATTLPVELTSFTATADGSDAATLRWETASETENAGFRVQHRRPDQPFAELAFVEGGGTIQEPQSYRYEAEELRPGRHVFRLEQVDLDGTTAHSEEVEVELGLASAYELSAAHPNPFRDRAQLRLVVQEAQTVKVVVYDALGRRVQTLYDERVEANAPQNLMVEGAGLASGLYFVRLEGEHFTTTRRLTLVR